MGILLYLMLLTFMNTRFCESYKILVSFPVPSKSHNILGNVMVAKLLKAGHEVTYITSYPASDPPPNLHQVDISSNINTVEDTVNINTIINKEVNLKDWRTFFSMVMKINRDTLLHENVQRLLNDHNQQFDLYITEWFYTETQVGMAAVFECPYIWVSTVEPHWLIMRLIDEYLHPAYNPDIQSSSSIPFAFFERVQELINQVMMTAIKIFYLNGLQEKEYTDIFKPILDKRGRRLPAYNEILFNASLVFGYSHVSLGQATRFPQSYKSIGGYHIQDIETPLPEDLKQLLDNAKNGVIYFSMGSILKSKDMPDVIKNGLLRMFGELKYTVLWKFEDMLMSLPDNVHILHWAPQQSILAHPNCVLFITHGGLLSTTEAVYFGKPMIGIPAFADQFMNVDRMVKKGFAKKVDLTFSLVEELNTSIIDILADSSYTEKAKQLSFIYHDRPVHPGAELVHWAEHVVKTRGAPHLRSPALAVPLYQKLYLDLIAVIVICIIIIIYAIKCVTSVFNKHIIKTKKLN